MYSDDESLQQHQPAMLYLNSPRIPNPYVFRDMDSQASQSPPPPPRSYSCNPTSQIGHLPLSQLLQNPHVLDLHEKVMKCTTVQLQHHEEMLALRRELAALKEENMQLRDFRQRAIRHQRGASASTNVSSVSPMDSASQVHMPDDDPDIDFDFRKSSVACPKGLDPKKVIWSLEDARADPKIGMTSANPGRPNMQKAIRKLDGTDLTDSEYRAILSMGKDVIRTHLDPLPVPQAWRNKKKGKRYYSEVHPLAWRKAVNDMDSRERLLTMCSGSWKSEHVLMRLLRPSDAPSQGENEPEAAEVGSTTAPSPTDSAPPAAATRDKRKRAASNAGKKAKKRTKQGAGGEVEGRERGKGENPSQPSTSTPSNATTDQASSPTTTGSSQSQPLSAAKAASIHSRISQLGGLKTPPGKSLATATADNAQVASSQPPEGSAASNPTVATPIDISFIEVGDSVADLRSEAASIKSLPKCTDSLLQAFDAGKEQNTVNPNDAVRQLLTRLQEADPNDPDLSSDDNNSNFGHWHFTAGSITIATALERWESVGSIAVACQLVAAALRIVKVARHVCFNRNLAPTNLISEAYVGILLEKLWQLWEDAHPQASASTTLDQDALRKQLQNIRKDHLQAWAKEHNIPVVDQNQKECNKDTLIANMLKLASKEVLTSKAVAQLKASTVSTRKSRPQRKTQGAT